MSFQEAISYFPSGPLRQGVSNAYNLQPQIADAIMARQEMPPERALMVGLSLDKAARTMFENAIDEHAAVDRDLPLYADEVIIGGGAHAAIYSAVRGALGYPKPLVIDRRGRFGGTFAMTKQSSFYLNSRNRPGLLGAVGSNDALNVIPGAPMQPSDLGGAEYQANADLGLVVRCTLALNATVRQAEVVGLSFNGGVPIVDTTRGLVGAKRVIVATGLGKPVGSITTEFDNKKVFSFEQFMRRFDNVMFPLFNLGRVAVIGAGDSGRTVIEALTGYGPRLMASVASLDYVNRIDWYGKDMASMTREKWLRCNRTRYKALAVLFPKDGAPSTARDNARVRGLDKFGNMYRAFDSIRVDGNAYDTVIICNGYKQTWRQMIGYVDDITTSYFRTLGVDERAPGVGGTRGVRLALANEAQTLFIVGPAANLEFDGVSDPEPRIEENRVALFRLAPRTAALAQSLSSPV